MSLLTGKYVWPIAGDLPGKKFQLDSKPFGIGILSGVWVRLPLYFSFPWVSVGLYKPTDTRLFGWYKTHDWWIIWTYNTMHSKLNYKAWGQRKFFQQRIIRVMLVCYSNHRRNNSLLQNTLHFLKCFWWKYKCQ